MHLHQTDWFEKVWEWTHDVSKIYNTAFKQINTFNITFISSSTWINTAQTKTHASIAVAAASSPASNKASSPASKGFGVAASTFIYLLFLFEGIGI